MADPTTLAIIPTLGERLDTLGKTLESVAAQGEGVRLVVVVPPAADVARRLATDHGATVVDDPRGGLSAAVNAGLAVAGTEKYIVWAGDDDLFRPGGFAALRGALESTPRAVASFGRCDYIDEADRVIGVSRAGAMAPRILGWGPDLIPQPAAMIRRSALEAVGGYDESLRYAMDLDVFLKLRRCGPLLSVPVTTAAFRWHSDSLTVSNREGSTREAQQVRHRYLPRPARALAPLWDVPLRFAAAAAARQVNRAGTRVARTGASE